MTSRFTGVYTFTRNLRRYNTNTEPSSQSLLDHKRRRFYGAHLTPSQIAVRFILPGFRRRLTDYLWTDLFCGEGSLIFPLVEHVKLSERAEFFANHVMMFDVQREHVEKAIQRAVELGIPRGLAQRRILVRDTLRGHPRELHGDLPVFHITNPPYLYRGYIAKKAGRHLIYFRGGPKPFQSQT